MYFLQQQNYISHLQKEEIWESPNIWELNNVLLKNLQVKEDRDIRKYLELNEDTHTKITIAKRQRVVLLEPAGSSNGSCLSPALCSRASHCCLDSQAGHGACRQGCDPSHSLFQGLFI